MKEIVVISGKGGTGKTSVTAALACSHPQDLVLADCDVDAADLHLIFQPQAQQTQDFISGVKALIDPQACDNCGLCRKVCRFDAIEVVNDQHRIIDLNCEGCAYCFQVCPRSAISLPPQKVGVSEMADTRLAVPLAHARLDIGADNSGKLVARVKRDAHALAKSTDRNLILVDGSPGIGCPVISSLSGADHILLVTEPTRSGLEDMKRVWQVARKFHLSASCVINKADINPAVRDQIKLYLKGEKIGLVAELPYSPDFSSAISLGISLVEYNHDYWSPIFRSIWEILLKELQ